MGNGSTFGGWIVWAATEALQMSPRSVVLCPNREAAAGNLAALAFNARLAGAPVQAIEEGIRVKDPASGEWGVIRMGPVEPTVWDDLVARIWINVRAARFDRDWLDGLDLAIPTPSPEIAADLAAAMIGGDGFAVDLFAGDGNDDDEQLAGEGEADGT